MGGQAWDMNGHLEIKDLSLGRSLQGDQGELETCLLSSYLGSETRSGRDGQVASVNSVCQACTAFPITGGEHATFLIRFPSASGPRLVLWGPQNSIGS